jgi:uncharacterized protein YbbK (DUF523 family)/diacylglycerol kinase family enzyme
MLKILVSECLYGDYMVRYDAGDASCKHAHFLQWKNEGRLVPVCPEVFGGLDTPRLSAERRGSRVYTSDDRDVTAEFTKGAKEALRLAKKHNVVFAIMKARSPSCGEDGLATEMLRAAGFTIFDETQIEEAAALLAQKESELQRKNLFIINPKSFRNKNGIERIKGEILDYFNVHEGTFSIEISSYPRDAVRIIQKHVKEASKNTILRIFAVGGDGILFDCLNGMFDLPNVELAAIPYGSSNDFICAFGKGKEKLFRNIGKQIEAGVIPTDVISSRGIYALNTVTLGVESAAIYNSIKIMHDSDRKSRYPKWASSAIFAAMGVVSMFNKTIRGQFYDITTDTGEIFSRRYVCINIANGPCYGGKLPVCPTAIPNDGYLDLILADDWGTAGDLMMMGDFLTGGGVKRKIYTYRQVKSVEIHSNQPLLIDMDGEPFFNTDVRLELLPHAIYFVAPEDSKYIRRHTRS